MKPTICCAATFRDEHNALPGFLESATRFFDEILLIDCGPGGTPSADGSREIIQKWGLPEPPCWDINAGFGAVRSRLLQEAKSDWTVIMDVDERLHVYAEVLGCDGTESYPEHANPALTVTHTGEAYNQRKWLNELIIRAEAQNIKAVRFSRRHWFDCSYLRPTQNWTTNSDWQLRCMKSRSSVGFTTEPKMHEQAWDNLAKRSPQYIESDPRRGPFFDHLHCHFKPMEAEQRKADIAIYDALHFSKTHTPIPK